MLVGVIAPSVIVIAGVVVGFATTPLTPLAVTTETEVTEPVPEIVCHVGVLPGPFDVRTCPNDPSVPPIYLFSHKSVNELYVSTCPFFTDSGLSTDGLTSSNSPNLDAPDPPLPVA